MKLSIAPMIDWSYTHFRVLMKGLAPRALCYTEMQTVHAITHNPARALDLHPSEFLQAALQVGGSEPALLAEVSLLAQKRGFSEINLNLGCPSDRVQKGQFGACLMLEPDRVMACVRAMKAVVDIPVTAKVRIGIDEQDSYEFFRDFAHQLVFNGCDKLIVHARKAWLRGLSPKQNRTIPPLHYDYVYRIKQEMPSIPVIINGNIQYGDLDHHLRYVDGVMLGRMAIDNPYQIALIHHQLYKDIPIPTRVEVLQAYIIYLQSLPEASYPISLLIKPLLNLAHGLAQNKRWKNSLLSLKQWNDWAMWDNFVELLKCLENP